MTYHHPEVPDRLTHVLSFASIALATIQGYYLEAQRELWRHLLELTGPGRPLQGVFYRYRLSWRRSSRDGHV